MIRQLKKKISILLEVLIGLIFVIILIVLNIINYNNQLNAYKRSVYASIVENGWKDFLNGKNNETCLDEMDYCIVQFFKDKDPEIRVWRFPGMTSEELIERAIAVKNRRNDLKDRITDRLFSPVLYIRKENHKSGKLIVLFSGKPVLEAAAPFLQLSLLLGLLGILALGLATRQLSRWLVAPVEKSVQSEKDFMSNASHELKTPLSVIVANISLLAEEIGDNAHLNNIRLETEYMTNLIQKMLTLVKLDAPMQEEHKKFMADNAVLEIVYPLESVAYEKGIHLDIKVQDNMQIMGDEEQVKSVVRNLLDNAIDHTAEGGTIMVNSYIHSHNFYLQVSNSGEPIPKEVREKLFERFYRSSKARSCDENHLGLGLSIVSSIAANHFGSVTVESTDGQNCFTVVLPLEKHRMLRKEKELQKIKKSQRR